MRKVFLNYILSLSRKRLNEIVSYGYVHECNNSIIFNRLSRKVSHSPRGFIEFSSEDPLIIKYMEKLVSEYESKKEFEDCSKLKELRPLIDVWDARREICKNLSCLKEMRESGDKDLASLAEEESQLYKTKLEELESELFELLMPTDQQDSSREVVMEISAGVGGQEAMLFAKELHNMYTTYANYKGWSVEVAEMAVSEIGGLRHSSVFISGDDVFKYLKHEAGVHRVQRIPSTERSGRVHTSTVSVTVLPQPEEVEVELKDKDLRIETKRASGAGGQHVNKTDSAVRITHVPTGIVVECQVDRSQIKNKRYALQRLRAKLYQLHLDEQLAKANAARKMQVKSNFRSEKIRTYNFNQDRITDHRLSDNMHNMESFLSGGELLDELIYQLEVNLRKERFQQMICEATSS